jgi:hypothetical protein
MLSREEKRKEGNRREERGREDVVTGKEEFDNFSSSNSWLFNHYINCLYSI